MISELHQEQAALYALELLDAEEAAAFERLLLADAELRALVAELRDAASSLAEAAEAEADSPPPPKLKNRILSRIAAEGGIWADEAAAADNPAKGKIVAGPWGQTWLPWAMAACLLICCGVLAVSRERWRRDFSTLERKTAAVEASAEQMRIQSSLVATRDNDALRKVAFVPLDPVKAPSLPRAAVLWDAEHRKGELRLSHLQPPGQGKDYQLWVVVEGRKDAVSAGVVTPDATGSVTVPFQPSEAGGNGAAAAFALSVERAGGSPTNQGPILFLGKL